jgi:hypothetical protein
MTIKVELVAVAENVTESLVQSPEKGGLCSHDSSGKHNRQFSSEFTRSGIHV